MLRVGGWTQKNLQSACSRASELKAWKLQQGLNVIILHLASLEFLWIDQSKNALGLQLSMPKVGSRTHFFIPLASYGSSSNLPKSSMRGWGTFFHLTSYGTLKLRALSSIGGQAKKIIFLTSNSRHQKLEAEQSNIPRTLVETRAQKLGTSKFVEFSSNLFPKWNFWF